MKKLLLLCVVVTCCNISHAQLNMGGQIREQLQVKNELQVLGKPEELNHLFTPLDSIKFHTNDPKFKWSDNIVGYKVYYTGKKIGFSDIEVTHRLTGPLKKIENRIYLCENPADSTICFKELPVDYYEVVGIIRYKEQASKYIERFNQLELIKNPDLLNRDKDILSKFIQYMQARLISISDFEREVKLYNRIPKSYTNLFYVIQSSTSPEIYYMPKSEYKGVVEGRWLSINEADRIKQIKGEKAYLDIITDLCYCFGDVWGQYGAFISIPYYDLIVNTLKGQNVFIWLLGNAFEDYVTNVLIDNVFKDNFNPRRIDLHGHLTKDDFSISAIAKCVDIFVHDDFQICGLFEVNGSKFTLPIGNVGKKYISSLEIPKDHYTSYYTTYITRYYFPFFYLDESTRIPSYDGCIIAENTIKDILYLFNEAELENAQKQAKAEAERKRIEAERAKLRAEEKARHQKWLKEEAERKAQWQAEMIREYGEKYGNAIIEGKVMLGMSQQMCQEAWGRPIDKYNTFTPTTSKSTWLYNYKTFLHFVDGKLVKIEN